MTVELYARLILVRHELGCGVVHPVVLLAEVGIGAPVVVVMRALPHELYGVLGVVHGPVPRRPGRRLRIDERMNGFEVWVVADACLSRRELDWQMGLRRMGDDGARVVTAEAVLFELLGAAGGPVFKELSRRIR